MKERKASSVASIFPLLLLLVFAIFALFVLMFSANIYKSQLNSSSLNNESKIAVSYLCEKIHQNDTAGSIDVINIDGSDVLELKQNVGGVDYSTLLYFFEGSVRELFIKSGKSVDLSNGEEIISAKTLEIERTNANLLNIQCSDDKGNSSSIMIAIRSEVSSK